MFRHKNEGFSTPLIIFIFIWLIIFISALILWKYPGFSSKDKGIDLQNDIKQEQKLPEKEESANGANIKESPDNSTSAQPYLITKSFSYPYPVDWQETNQIGDAIKFSLTKVSLGKKSIEANNEGGIMHYATSGDIHSLTLYLKINIPQSGAGPCVYLNLRRLINEEGDMDSPINTQFFFPPRGGCLPTPGKTYYDQEIIFAVPDSEKEFIFTTGGESNIFFEVKIINNTEIKVEKVATSEEGNCSDIYDNLCPSICDADSDADCCKKTGKYWLQTPWGYGCYDSNYNPGCTAGRACSQASDDCCPNWCSAGSDKDCCIQIKGNFWVSGQGCFSYP